MRNIAKFHTIGFLRGLYFYLPIFTLYLVDHNVSLADVVFSQTFYSLLKFIGEVPTGLFADKYGQKASMIIGYLLEALGIFIVFLSPTTLGLYLCYAIGGFAASFLSGSEEALLYESAKRQRANYQKAYGVFMSNQTIGMVVSTFICGVLVQQFGAASYGPLLVATSVAVALSALLSMTLKSFRAKVSDPVEGSGMFTTLTRSIRLIRKDDTVFNLMLVSMLTISGEYFLYSVYQPRFEDLGVAPIFLGFALSAGLVVHAVATRYVYLLERYLTLDKIILMISVGLGSLYLAMGWTPSAPVMIAAFIAALGLLELQTPIVSDYINERAESDIRSTVLSGISFAQRMVNVVFRAGLAYMVTLGGVQLSFYAQGIYLILGACIGYWLLVRCGCVHRVTHHNGVPLEKL